MPRTLGYVLGIIPFLIVVGLYFSASEARLKDNPKDKLMPGPKQLVAGWQTVWELKVRSYEEYTVKEGDTALSVVGNQAYIQYIEDEVFETLDPENPRALVPGEVLRVPMEFERLVLNDVSASLGRLLKGLAIGIIAAIFLGVGMGAFTPLERAFFPVTAALAKIPPIAILPILFIFLGATGDTSKIAIIALGIAPTMTLDILLRAKDVPRELITKAYTLGASTTEVVFKVIMPIIWPQVLNAIRLVLGPAWVYLIAAEAISANAGLGYRIFVVQRQLGMNIILIYIAIIMMIGLAMDMGLKAFITWRYKWAEVK